MFGMMNDFDDDPIFGHHVRSMRQMNNMMNSLFADPFGGMAGGMFGGLGMGMPNMQMNNLESIMGAGHMRQRHSMNNMMMPFGAMGGMNMNRLLNTDHMPENALSYSSSSVFSMSSGPDGVPQVYQASSSTRSGPGGIRETRKTVQDSRSGTKQMAIGHHIGDRAHIIERQQNIRTGQHEENQEFINLDDTEAEDFDREFQHKARSSLSSLSGGRRLHQPEMLALPAPSPPNENKSTVQTSRPYIEEISTQSLQQPGHNVSRRSIASPRRAIHTHRAPTMQSSPLAGSSPIIDNAISTSVHPHPYHHGGASSRKSHRALKGPSSSNYHQH